MPKARTKVKVGQAPGRLHRKERTIRDDWIPAWGQEDDMLNFEEELEKFQPSLEIDQAEEAVMKNDLSDISDLLEQAIDGIRDKR